MTYEQYVDEHWARLSRFAAVLTADRALAEDVLQWPRVSTSTHMHAYVRRMVVNEFVSSHRKLGRIVLVDDLTDLVAPIDGPAEQHAQRIDLLAQLSRLPARQRAAAGAKREGDEDVMTPTEDDLRGALLLLEQRGPETRPDVQARSPRSGSRFMSTLQLGSVAALVLIVAGGAALLGLRHDGTQPTPPGTTQPAPPGKSSSPELATLHVRAAYRSQLNISATTDRHGVATFALPAGRYAYRTPQCGAGFGTHAPVNLAAGQTASARIECAVP